MMQIFVGLCVFLQVLTGLHTVNAQGVYLRFYATIGTSAYTLLRLMTATCSGHNAAPCAPANSNCFNFNSDSLTTISCSGFPVTLTTLYDWVNSFYLLAIINRYTVSLMRNYPLTLLALFRQFASNSLTRALASEFPFLTGTSVLNSLFAGTGLPV